MNIIRIQVVWFIFKAAHATESCWWTGCQKNDWRVKGCEQYNRVQSDVRYCDNGQEYYCCPASGNYNLQPNILTNSEEACWWTGCQKNDWKVRGCENYNRIQRAARHCDNGQEYFCCPTTHNSSLQTSYAEPVETCWWTGCQKNDWAVQGCENYNRVQRNVRYCENGQEYYCCPGSGGTNILTTATSPVESSGGNAVELCWWTGCQKNDWTERGCQQYNRIKIDIKNCDNGQEYYCCPNSESTNVQTNVPDSAGNCWWTGCQKNDWLVRGCENYNRLQRNVRYCDNGQEYYCCPGGQETNLQNTVPTMTESCWWTGCQKNDWKVKGCDNYNRIQTNVRYCENGQEYYCCPRTTESNPQTFIPNAVESGSCWWTGCQKNDWKVKGCENYNRIQKDVRYCDNGQEYFCCPGGGNTSTLPSSNSAPECWWSSCQHSSWGVKGCPANMKAAGSQSCGVDVGDTFYCCPA